MAASWRNTSGLVMVWSEGRMSSSASGLRSRAASAATAMAGAVLRPTGSRIIGAAIALDLASRGYLATFGIVPGAPETGFGYIERGAPLQSAAYKVASFREKPDRASAEGFVASGRFLWNSGMFAFSPAKYLDELGRLRPEMLAASQRAYEKSTRDLDFLRLDREAFAT